MVHLTKLKHRSAPFPPVWIVVVVVAWGWSVVGSSLDWHMQIEWVSSSAVHQLNRPGECVCQAQGKLDSWATTDDETRGHYNTAETFAFTPSPRLSYLIAPTTTTTSAWIAIKGWFPETDPNSEVNGTHSPCIFIQCHTPAKPMLSGK